MKEPHTKSNNFFGSFNVHITHCLETLSFCEKRIDPLNRLTDFCHLGDSFKMRIEIDLPMDNAIT